MGGDSQTGPSSPRGRRQRPPHCPTKPQGGVQTHALEPGSPRESPRNLFFKHQGRHSSPERLNLGLQGVWRGLRIFSHPQSVARYGHVWKTLLRELPSGFLPSSSRAPPQGEAKEPGPPGPMTPHTILGILSSRAPEPQGFCFRSSLPHPGVGRISSGHIPGPRGGRGQPLAGDVGTQSVLGAQVRTPPGSPASAPTRTPVFTLQPREKLMIRRELPPRPCLSVCRESRSIRAFLC